MSQKRTTLESTTVTRLSKAAPRQRKACALMALEQRFMFDGAGAADVVDKTVHLELAAPAAGAIPEATLQARAQAEQAVAQMLARPDAQALMYQILRGAQTDAQPSAQWLAAFEQLQNDVNQGSLSIHVELRSNAELQGAKGAFSASGTTAQATMYLNADWLASADSESVTRVMVEEMGHYLDTRLNANADTPGDEGEIFSRVAIDGANPLSVAFLSEQNDHTTLTIQGQSVQAELASFNFVNAYAMVYDLNNNSTGTSSNITGGIDVGERWAEKEQNLLYFNASVSLGGVQISDGSNGLSFSGNDVSAIGIVINGSTYYGWISRPIKANGVVKGFYFWTDNDFTNLTLAQQDGNQDADANVKDNRGFLLVVDQSWFDTQINATKGATTVGINNLKDGNLGNIYIANVGSSSDRVDSALNGLVTSNIAPTGVNDLANGIPNAGQSSGQGSAALEQGYNSNNSSEITPTINASGNVLANDTDSNSDTLSVTTVTSKETGVSNTASTAGVTIQGKYGVLTIYSGGNWSYAVNNANPNVNALLIGSIQEQFSYALSDGKGGTSTATLTVQINGSNDAPVATNDYNIAKEHTSVSDTGYNASGNVLINDSDVDSGDGKSISGSSVGGSIVSSTITVSPGSSTLTFTGGSGASSVNGGEALYITPDGTNYYAAYASDGSSRITVSSGSLSTSITLS
ncbi:MAG: hypothetical protein FGM44_09950, partial [Limnohabitans sp.]|nr:hypothetical protein [Limnohabitans sp.]